VAITLIDWDELARWSAIDKALNLGCPAPAETYSSSPHLYAELDIPEDARGTVGPAKRTPRRETAERSTAARTRSRRRTRGGKSATGHVAADAPAEPEDGAAPRRRRRRRPRSAATANAS